MNKEHYNILFMFKHERAHAENKLNISLGILFFSLTFVSSLYQVLGVPFFISLIIIIGIEIIFIIFQLFPRISYENKNKKRKKIDDSFNIFEWYSWMVYDRNEIKEKFKIETKLNKEIIKTIKIINRKYLAFKIFSFFITFNIILTSIFLFIKLI